MLFHPLWAERSCADCKKWVVREDGTTQTRFGLPVLRPEGVGTPCWACPKVPRGAPEKSADYAVELGPKGRAAYYHYLGCLATGRFPDDPIVTRNAIVVMQVREAHARFTQDRVYHLLGGKL